MNVVWRIADVADVGGGVLEHLRLRGRVAGKNHGAVIGHIQPLVGVDGDRVGQLQPVHPICVAGGAPGEAAECAVDMQPEGRDGAHRGDGAQVVEIHRVDRPGVGDDDRRCFGLGLQRAS